MHRNYNIKLGVIFIIVGAFSFAIMSLFVKRIGMGATTTTIVFFRFAFSLIAMMPLFLKDIKKTVKVLHPVPLFLRSVLSTLALFCTFFALKYVSLFTAILLNNTMPLFVPLFAYLILRSHTPLPVWWGVLMGFVGIVLIFHPGLEVVSWYSLIALASGVFGAIAIVYLRSLGLSTPPQQVLFYYFVVGTLIAGGLLFFDWQPIDAQTFYYLCAVGLTGVIYQIGLTYSLHFAPVQLISSLLFSNVIFAGLLEAYFFHKIPDWFSIAGMVLIVIGSLVAIIFGRKRLVIHHKSEDDQ